MSCNPFGARESDTSETECTITDTKSLLDNLENGRHIQGDTGASMSPPQDFDMAKFDRGRRFFRDNLFSCSVGMLFSLIVGLAFPDFLNTLVLTARSDTPRKAMSRYMATFRHVAAWHYGNVWDKGSAAHRSILAVRKMHADVRGVLREERWPDFLSQYHMAIVQSPFIACAVLCPAQFGITCIRSDVSDYIYFWYGIGHLLGISPDYNICAGGLDVAQNLCCQIRDQVVTPNLLNPPADFDRMSRAVVNGHGAWFISVPMVTALYQEKANIKFVRLGLKDQLRLAFWKFLFILVKNIPVVKRFLNRSIERLYGLNFC